MSFIFIFFCIFLKLDGPERRLLRSISFISTSCFIHLTISSWAPEHWNVDNALDSRSLVSRCTRQSGPRVVSFGWSSRVPPPNGKLRPSDGYVTSDCLFVQGSARSSFFFLLLTSRQRFNCAEGGLDADWKSLVSSWVRRRRRRLRGLAFVFVVGQQSSNDRGAANQAPHTTSLERTCLRERKCYRGGKWCAHFSNCVRP